MSIVFGCNGFVYVFIVIADHVIILIVVNLVGGGGFREKEIACTG